jgi:hypothetical protein
VELAQARKYEREERIYWSIVRPVAVALIERFRGKKKNQEPKGKEGS